MTLIARSVAFVQLLAMIWREVLGRRFGILEGDAFIDKPVTPSRVQLVGQLLQAAKDFIVGVGRQPSAGMREALRCAPRLCGRKIDSPSPVFESA